MSNSILSSTISIKGTRVMQGASRGLDKPTLLAFLDFADFSVPDARLLLLTLDAGLCNRSPSITDQWIQYRDSQLANWSQTGLADAHGIANVILWLWMSLQQEYGNPSSEAVLRSVSAGQFELAAPYVDVNLANVTLQYAVKYINQAIADTSVGDELASQSALRHFFETAGKPTITQSIDETTRCFLSAANQRGIPWNRLTHDNYQLGWGFKARRMTNSVTDRTPVLAQQIAKNKAVTHYLLSRAGFPSARWALAESEDSCLSWAERIGYPVVIKPANQDRGVGVVTRLTCKDDVKRAYKATSQFGPVLVEEHIEGEDYRLLVVGGSLLAAAHRIPGGVTGNGRSTVRELVDQANNDPRRGTDKAGLVRLAVDDEAQEVLRKQGLVPDAIPESGRVVSLREVPTVERGGTPVDVTQSVHRDNRLLVERASRIVGLDIAGFDLLIPDITKSWREIGGAIIEVNCSPAFTALQLAQPERDIYGEILDWMFDGGTGRIPVVAIAGSQGQDSVSRILHRILRSAGICAGVATTQGVWIGDALEIDRDMSGSLARDVLLIDPSVEAAVIETSTVGLMSQGHPCDHYTVAALLNVCPDGQAEYSPEASARVMAEVLERAMEAVVVNADDPLCLAMLEHATPKRRILVGESGKSANLQTHMVGGGEAVFVEEDVESARLLVRSDGRQTSIMALAELTIPPQMEREVYCQYALFAAALAYAIGINVEHIRHGLISGEGWNFGQEAIAGV